jgi:hypothetical protein
MTINGRHPFQLSFLHRLNVSLCQGSKYNPGVRRKVEWKWLSYCTVHVLLDDLFSTQFVKFIGFPILKGTQSKG